MRLRAALMIVAASASITGCANYNYNPGTPEQRAAYASQSASMDQFLQQSNQNLTHQTANIQRSAQAQPTVQVAPVQTDQTAIVSCRDLTGMIIACKQVN